MNTYLVVSALTARPRCH